MDKYKPGAGWHKLSPAVYENGALRVHIGGTCRLLNGFFISGNTINSEMDSYIKIAGGNRKRGIMVWAKSVQEIIKK